ncbi:acylphosphatase [Lentilactobacillus senioris]|uniref:acylphosphatase n=1 Tax=Lentilactobacillus senioris TaxID=931534 RepID=UPI003D27C12B
MTLKTISINVTGIVQGVGFRYYTIKAARKLDLTGWVKNLPDGSVQIMATGPAEQLDQFSAIVKKSPAPAGKVTNFTINYLPYHTFDDFNVKY